MTDEFDGYDIFDRGNEQAYFAELQSEITAVPTPLPSWNRWCMARGGNKGLALGWYVIIGGAANQGKTLVALNCAAHASNHQYPSGVVSMEMEDIDVYGRVIPIVTGVHASRMKFGDPDPSALEEVVEKLAKRPLMSGMFVNSRMVSGIHDVLGFMDEYVKMGAKVIVVDYMQLVTTDHTEAQIRESVTQVSRAMRSFARQKSVAVIGVSQLNRLATRERDRAPTIHDLIGASALENDADQILLLDHSRYERDGNTAQTYIRVGKNRYGPKGDIPIQWDYRTFRVREGLPDEEHKWPK